jgi:hypothetical protein
MLVQTVSIGGHSEDMPCLGPVPLNEIHAAARKEGILNGNVATRERGVVHRIGPNWIWEGQPDAVGDAGENPYMLTTPHPCSLKSVSTCGEGEYVWDVL